MWKKMSPHDCCHKNKPQKFLYNIISENLYISENNIMSVLEIDFKAFKSLKPIIFL